MKKGAVFKEKQRFTQWWIWLIILGLDILYSYGIVKQVIFQVQFGNKPVSNLSLVFLASFIFVLTLIFVSFRLETEIDEKGIHVRFFPFHLSFRHYSWEKISNCYVRKYRPLVEYGGWGIRGIGKNKALNVKGNMGIQIEFSDGRRLLIGTSKADEVSRLLTGQD